MLGNNGRGKISIILIIALLLAGVYVYFEYFVEKPNDVVYSLIESINEKDISASMECIDPKYQRLYTTTNKLLDKFIGFSIDDLSNIFPFLFEMAYADGAVEDVRFQIVKVTNETITGNTAVVEVLMETRDRYGKRIDGGTSYFYLQKFNVGWRIVDMQ